MEFDFKYQRFLLYILVLFFIEFLQLLREQPFTTFLTDLIFFSSLLFVLHVMNWYSLVTLAVYVYEIMETASWMYTGNGITFRFIHAMDLAYALQSVPGTVMALFLLFLFAMAFCFFPFAGKSVRIPHTVLAIVAAIALVSSYFFVSNKLDILYPFRRIENIRAPASERIENSFSQRWRASMTGKKKNLIMIEIESLEANAIGKFNKRYPKSMPYLSSLTDSAMYFTNIKSQPYTTWSAAGMFVAQCGLPLLQDDVHWDVRQHGDFLGYRRVPCIPDFLRLNGYKLYAYCSASCEIMNMKNFFIDRGYHTEDEIEHRCANDESLLSMLEDDVLPRLAKESQPFMLIILNDDTHFINYRIAGVCDDHLRSEGYPMSLRAYTCVDYMISKFMERVKELHLDENTEIVIYGDHLTMGDKTSVFGRNSERNLTVFFPLHKQDLEWKSSLSQPRSYYDLAPTILQFLGVEYSPPFPFGSTLLSPEVGPVPTTNDLMQIYKHVTGHSTFDRVRCLGRAGFCEGNEY